MCELANLFPNAKGLKKKALNQCARELLLAQSSDWLFIITNGTMVDYVPAKVEVVDFGLNGFTLRHDDVAERLRGGRPFR